jgi:hypothetical protein
MRFFDKAANIPIFDLFNGPTNNQLPIISLVHAGDPNDMRARVSQYRNKGYLDHFVKTGAIESEGGRHSML